MRHLALAAALVVFAALPAAAQIGNPGGMRPDTPLSEPGKPAPHQPNTQDRLFIHLVGAGGMAEVESARLAERKGAHAAVKDFARRMAEDHAKANQQLTTLAKAAGVPLPDAPNPDDKAQLAELDSLSGAAFEKAYMLQQLVAHQKTAMLMQWEISSGQDAELQRFAMQKLPVVLEHLEIAQRTIALLTGAEPQGLAASAPGPQVVAPKPNRSGQRSTR